MRTIKYYDEDSKSWLDIEWSAVVSGSLVQMFEEDGTPIQDGTGIHEMNVMSDAYQQTISGVGEVWTVEVADPDPTPFPRREK